MPYAVLFTGAMALVLEPLSEFAEMEWATSQCLAVVAISGVAAFFVNLSGFLVMGTLPVGAFFLSGVSFRFVLLTLPNSKYRRIPL